MLNISWLIDERVILIDFGETVTQDDSLYMNTEIINYFDSSSYAKVHIIFVADNMLNFPKNIMWIRQNITFFRHPKYGYNITITSNALLTFLGIVSYKAFQVYIPRFVKNYDEANAQLFELDPTLPTLPMSIGE